MKVPNSHVTWYISSAEVVPLLRNICLHYA